MDSMTDNEINIAIAIHCGWQAPSADYMDWKNPAGHYSSKDLIPNYCGDLNAMHEAELCIPPGKLGYYNAELSKIACKRTLSSAVKEPDFIFMLLHTTARQRAEAYVRTIGK